MKKNSLFAISLILLVFISLGNRKPAHEDNNSLIISEKQAKVTRVNVKGTSENYTFFVEIRSPDTGCDQYANWWEVVSEDGNLIYRRILGHSHVNEQPFVRSGGKIAVKEDQKVYIRAHMNSSGYGTQAFFGSVSEGFSKITLDKEFADTLEKREPLPKGCAF